MDVTEQIDRNVPYHAYSDVVAMAMMVYTIPKPMKGVQALVVFPGFGEHSRITNAINWWEQLYGDFFLIGGVYPKEKTFERLDILRLEKKPFSLRRVIGVETQIIAQHTKDQAEWVYTRAMALGIQSIALFAPPFHCLRAYVTLLKTFIDHRKNDVVLIPAPTPVAPSRLIPEFTKNAWDLVPGEVERIITYQKKGDVATREELACYLEWLWGHTLIKNMEVQ